MRHFVWGLALIVSLLIGNSIRAEGLSASALNAFTNYTIAKTNYRAQLGEIGPAIAFAKACADWADDLEQKEQRAAVAEEGIGAARFARDMAATNAAAFYYLGLNYGELARTKSVGALSLVKRMERALIKAAQLEPSIEHGGPDRSLGMLYRDAPGHPASIGSRTKAQEHLERALQLAPDYPDNFLTLLESYRKWNQEEDFRTLTARYKQLLPSLKKKYSGPEWESIWVDWNSRWIELQK